MYYPKIIILSGPSGVGKGTIEKNLFNIEDLNLKFSISATTRKPRINEINGIDYYFLSEKDFLNLIEKNSFIEWNKHLDNYYGTLKSEVDKILKSNKNVLIEVETNGALNILKYYESLNNLDKIIPIFILPPSIEELKNRILKRGTETEEQIEKRLLKAKEELSLQNNFKYKVWNYDPLACIEEIKKIIIKETNGI